MRIESFCRLMLVSACLAGPAMAQDAPTDAKPAANDAPTTAPTALKSDAKPDSPQGKLLPEVSVSAVPLRDLIGFLRDLDPTFQAVVSYAPGADKSGPQIEELNLKNVSADSVLQVLSQAYPQVHVQPFSREGDRPIWMIRVEPVPEAVGTEGMGGGFGGPGFAVPGGMAIPNGPITVVHRLHEIVDELAGEGADEDARKKALESILSLVKTAIETQGNKDGDVSLKLHEATETLVFNGTPMKAELVAQTLANLVPPADVKKQRDDSDRARLLRERDELRKQLAALKQAGGIHPPPPVENPKPDPAAAK